MSSFAQASTLIIQTLGTLYLFVVVMRFLLQLSKASFYNPISQFIVKATHLPSKPIRTLLPAYRSFDMASLVLALIVQVVCIQLTALVNNVGLMNILPVIAWGALGILSVVIAIYKYGLLIVIIMSWVAPQSQHPGLMLLNQLMRPAMAPLQKVIPPLGGLDLSPILLFLIIQVIEIALSSVAASLQLPWQIVPGIW